MTDPGIDQLLDVAKAGGHSSLTRTYWQKFYELLLTANLGGQGAPPVPMILAAYGESGASKHRRLRSQLGWALANECLDMAA